MCSHEALNFPEGNSKMLLFRCISMPKCMSQNQEKVNILLSYSVVYLYKKSKRFTFGRTKKRWFCLFCSYVNRRSCFSNIFSSRNVTHPGSDLRPRPVQLLYLCVYHFRDLGRQCVVNWPTPRADGLADVPPMRCEVQ